MAPLVIVEIKNKRFLKPITPCIYHFLDIISKYTAPKFTKGEQLLTYGQNIMPEQGTHLFIFDLKTKSVSKDAPP